MNNIFLVASSGVCVCVFCLFCVWIFIRFSLPIDWKYFFSCFSIWKPKNRGGGCCSPFAPQSQCPSAFERWHMSSPAFCLDNNNFCLFISVAGGSRLDLCSLAARQLMLAYKALIYFVLIADYYLVHKRIRVFSYDDCSSGTFRILPDTKLLNG